MSQDNSVAGGCVHKQAARHVANHHGIASGIGNWQQFDVWYKYIVLELDLTLIYNS